MLTKLTVVNFVDIERLLIDSSFMPALTKVLQIRSQRKLFYGDRWKEDPDWALLAEIRQKYLRLEHSLLRDLKKEESAEKDLVIDTLIDLTVYSLFLLNNFLDREDTCE